MNLLAPIFFILASVGIFYGYTDPNYRGENKPENIVKLMNERKQYLEALNKSADFIAETNRLTKINNELSNTDLERLKKLLPDNIDNVRLVIDIEDIASRHGFSIRNIKIDNSAESQEESQEALGADDKPYGTLVFSFNITSSYDRFRAFVKDLEESLRIVDITGISFVATDGGDYDYGLKIKTYWIK